MRKHVFFWKSLVGILPFLFLGTACDSASDDPEPYLRISAENQAITLSAEEASQTIEIETNTSEWAVSVSAEGKDWCTVKKDGESILVSVGKNEGVDDRSATLTVRVRNIEVKITVTQSGTTPVLQIEGDKAIEFQPFGGDAPVNLTTNLPTSEWDFAFSDPTASEWCHIIEKGDKQFTISVDENIGTTSRTVEITVTSNRIPADQQPKINILQFGTEYTLQVSESNKNFTAAQESSSVTLLTNIRSGKWSYVVVDPAESWCHVEIVKTSDDKNNELKISVDANLSVDPRTAVITISSEFLPDAPQTVTVTQAGAAPVLEVASDTQEFTVIGGEVILDITTNLPLEELTATLTADWCDVKIEGGKLKITVTANAGQELRNVTVTISDKQRPTVPQVTISVTQESPTLTIAESTKNFEIEEGTATVDINTNIPFGELSVTFDPEATWCIAKIEDGKLKITVESNKGEKTKERKVEITISSAKFPSVEEKLTVAQVGTQLVLQISGGFEELPIFGYEGDIQVVPLTTNFSDDDIDIAYDGTTSSTVCNAEIVNKQLTITVFKNTEQIERTVTITLSAEGVEPVTITVKQTFPTLQVPDDGVIPEVKADGDTKTVDIDTNIPSEKWDFIPKSDTWYLVTKEGNRLTIIVDPNISLGTRDVTITLSSADLPGVTRTITINQAAADPSLQITGSNEISLGYLENESTTVPFTTNVPIKELDILYGSSSESPGWCHVDIEGNNLKVTATDNNNGTESRSVVITITFGGKELATINVTQEIPTLQVSVNDATQNFGADETTARTVDIDTNIPTGEWTVTPSETNDWCHVTKGDKQLSIQVDANTSAKGRTAQLTLSSAGLSPVIITINQAGAAPYLLVLTDVLEFGADDTATTTKLVTISTNIPDDEWTFASSVGSEWCLVSRDGKQLTIGVDKNESFVERDAVLTLSSVIYSVASQAITVIQAGVIADLALKNPSDATQNFEATETGNKTVILNTNIPIGDWTFAPDNINGNWYSVEKGEKQLIITVLEPNTSVRERTVEIEISSIFFTGVKPKITVKQAGAAAILALHNEGDVTQEFEAAETTDRTVTFNTNIPINDWTFTPSPSVVGDWYHVTKGDKQLVIQLDENTSLEGRSVVLELSSTFFSGEKPKITVTQAGAEPKLAIVESYTGSLGAAGGTVTVDIDANIPWTFTPEGDTWYQVSKEGNKLTIAVDPNTDLAGREIVLTLSSSSEYLPEVHPVITINQVGAAPVLALKNGGDATQDFEATGGTETVDINTNIPSGDLNITYGESQSWCGASIAEGNQLKIDVSANTGEQRSVVITIASATYAVPAITITVIQAAPPVLEIAGNPTRNLEYVGGSEIVATTNIPKEKLNILYDGQTSSDWCTSSIEGNQLKIDVTSNTGAESRTVVITIASDYLPGTTVTITVTQKSQWTKVDLGGSKAGGSYTFDGSEISVTGKGLFSSDGQTLTFVYQKISGNFEIIANLISYIGGRDHGASNAVSSHAGLMFTPNISETGKNFVFALASKQAAKEKFSYIHRLSTGGGLSRTALEATGVTASGDAPANYIYSNVYLKLERTANKYKASYSVTGANGTYILIKEDTFTGGGLPLELYVGFAVNNGFENNTTGTATFSDIRITPKP
ncbi:hypothetical protein EZS27_007336 [termite gut metagenome]|uniref:BACON domain-containing protein n=1 Tax=termite gut metagenome TaxID=433724 RepID=A0A5J4SII3_9ZZZZ